MHILFAEDDRRLGNLIQHMLQKEGMMVDWVVRGDTALEYAAYSPYDVIILDWMMPGQTGLAVCEQLREQGYHQAILLLTAKDAVEDRVLGLDTGADDYLVKPFEFSELLARLRALCRRSSHQLKEDVVEFGGLALERTGRVLRQPDGSKIQLSGREFQILDMLLQNKGQVVPRELILDRVWGLEAEVTSNNLDAYVRLLRKKIDPSGGNGLLQTVRGIGYKLEEA